MTLSTKLPRLMYSRLMLVSCVAVFVFGLISASPNTRGQATMDASCLQRNILFVSGEQPPPGRDMALIEHLETFDHTVVVRRDMEVQSADAAGKDLVIISESSLSTNIGGKMRDVSVPVITWEGALYDDMRMTGPAQDEDYGVQYFERDIHISDADHPLAGGLDGSVRVVRNRRNTFYWAMPSQHAVVVARPHENSARAHIFAYEAGVEMFGLIAPARRVGFPNANGQDLTGRGFALFDAAVNWAMDCSDGATAAPTATATNTPSPTGTRTPVASTTPTSVATPSPSATTAPTAMSILKNDFLFHDADANDVVSQGDTLFYDIKIVNNETAMSSPLQLVDQLDENIRLIAGSVRTIGGVIVQGNGDGDDEVVVNISPLLGGAYASVGFEVRVEAQPGVTEIQNQALAIPVDEDGEPTGQAPIPSDDPATTTVDDPTVTALGRTLAPSGSPVFLPLIQID